MKVVKYPFKFYVNPTLDVVEHSNNSLNEVKIIMEQISILINYFLLALSSYVIIDQLN